MICDFLCYNIRLRKVKQNKTKKTSPRSVKIWCVQLTWKLDEAISPKIWIEWKQMKTNGKENQWPFLSFYKWVDFLWQNFCQNHLGHQNRFKIHIRGCKWLRYQYKVILFYQYHIIEALFNRLNLRFSQKNYSYLIFLT